jgi:hypothetical protein
VYEQLYGPLGPERLDHLFAMLQATIANANRGKKSRPYKPEQFMPGWGRSGDAEPERQALDGYEMLNKIRSINRAMGGK